MCMYVYEHIVIHPCDQYPSPFCFLQQYHIDACHEQAVQATGNLKLSDSWETPDVSNEVLAFCDRFSLGPEESLQEGWRLIQHELYTYLYAMYVCACIPAIKYVGHASVHTVLVCGMCVSPYAGTSYQLKSLYPHDFSAFCDIVLVQRSSA